MKNVRRPGLLTALAVILGLGGGLLAPPVFNTAPAAAQTGGQVPGKSLGVVSDAEIWRAVRRGVAGSVSIPDKKAATLVQAEGDQLRMFRNGPMARTGAYALGAVIVLLTAFFFIRGRIRIEAGPSPDGAVIERFNGLERAAHWLTASSFIVLALTGLNLMYGKFILMPVIGKTAFAALTYYGKMSHNYLGFAFMAGIALMFVLWARSNIPSKHDLEWLAKGGGLFTKGVHPPSPRFNAGQKLIFWITVLGGLTLSTSGVMLMFPFEFAAWGKTFGALNVFGFGLPADLTPLQETQLSLLWHGGAALAMIVVIVAHIYIGSIGMEGAIDAVGSGQVDRNWALEHHNIWVAEIEGRAPDAHSHGQSAE